MGNINNIQNKDTTILAIIIVSIFISSIIYQSSFIAQGSRPDIRFAYGNNVSDNKVQTSQPIFNGNNNTTQSNKTANGITWTTYSNASNGLSFDYPSIWKVEYVNGNEQEIKITNSDRHNGIMIILPNVFMENILNNYSTLQEAANNLANMTFGTTIIQPFTKKIINGFPATMGIVSSEGPNPNDSKKGVEILLQHNGKIYSLEYYDTPNNYDTPDSQAIMKRFILSFDILQNNSSISLSNDNTLNGNNNTTWTKSSSSGISFDYPSNWKVEYPNIHDIIITNSSDPYNAFYISRPIHNNTDPSLNVADVANNVLSHRPGTTIIEPFKEDFIAGSTAAVGKTSLDIGVMRVMSNVIVINHNGQVFVFQYSNTPEKFDSYNSQQTMNHIISSLSFT